MSNLRSFPLACALAALSAAGCGSPAKKVVTVTGSVLYQNQKLTSGSVTFVAANGDTATAMIQADGTFTMTDVVPGVAKVGYRAGPQSTASSAGPAKGQAAPKPVVPAKFLDPNASNVTVNIDPDKPDGVVVELR